MSKPNKLDVLIKCLPEAPFKEQLTAEVQKLLDVLDAAKNLRDVMGRHHSEQAYRRLMAAVAEVDSVAGVQNDVIKNSL